MLNRRSLRIKVMQSLFALQQCKEASFELSLERIGDTFAPDLNSMEVQNKDLLAQQKKSALKLFQEAFESGEFKADHEDEKIKKTVNGAFVFYKAQLKKDSDFFGKNLVVDVEKIYEHYIATLSLVVAFVELAEADKKLGHKNFVNNSWVKALKNSEELRKERRWLKKQSNLITPNQTQRSRCIPYHSIGKKIKSS
jgi:N utilization substance protein B